VHTITDAMPTTNLMNWSCFEKVFLSGVVCVFLLSLSCTVHTDPVLFWIKDDAIIFELEDMIEKSSLFNINDGRKRG